MRFDDLQTAPAPRAGRPIRTAAFAAALATAAILTAAPAAAELLIFHVYVAGPNGGTIEVEDGGAVPAGTCGIRVQDPEYWYWAEGDYAEIGELDIPGNGQAMNVIEISGAFAATCENAATSAVTPATPEGWPPDEAVSLVIQGWSDDVEYLDYNNDPLPVPIPPDSPEEPGSICEMVPEFCEEPPPLTILPFCEAFPDLCSPFEAEGLNFVRASELGGSAGFQLARAQQLLAPPANRPAALAALSLALERTRFAATAVRALRQQDDELAAVLGATSHPPRTYAIADRASARIELGNVSIASCQRALETAQRRLLAGGTPALAPAIASCGRAAELLAGGRAANDALRAWALSTAQP